LAHNNDRGWSQAHYDAAEYVTEKMEGVSFVYVDKVNTLTALVPRCATGESLLEQGATAIIFNSMT
jgi:simple sugar transport system substrate-binding protein